MADIITDAAAIEFCNTKIRPLCNAIGSIDITITSIMNEYNANNLAQFFPNTTTSVVQDTSVTGPDGRNPITGANVLAIIAFFQVVQTALSANTNADRNVVDVAAVNLQTLA